ncbi:helix-turn-helix domain-containing protein [Methylorubrum rhodesianum]|uniref:Helix-turn-helix domain-containing protein n=1 Tax=Methylorubrum rhodesianum TaxID=29427 RepID=A0ABU9ZFI7_9HYPH
MSALSDADLAEMLQAALSLGEVAEMLGLSVRQVQHHVDDGSLVAVNLGRGSVRKDLRVLDADLQGFLARRRTSAAKVATFQDARDARPKPLPAQPTFAERRAARKSRQAR